MTQISGQNNVKHSIMHKLHCLKKDPQLFLAVTQVFTIKF